MTPFYYCSLVTFRKVFFVNRVNSNSIFLQQHMPVTASRSLSENQFCNLFTQSIQMKSASCPNPGVEALLRHWIPIVAANSSWRELVTIILEKSTVPFLRISSSSGIIILQLLLDSVLSFPYSVALSPHRLCSYYANSLKKSWGKKLAFLLKLPTQE